MKIFHDLYWRAYRKITQDKRIIPLPRRLSKIMGNPAIKKVFILTYCFSEKQLYGTTLIFKTIRIGFPNACIVVIDNASIPMARKKIKRLAKEASCEFFQIDSEISHHTYLEDLVMNQPLQGTVINLDPDVVFWESCENWKFNHLLAGRRIPTYVGVVSKCITKPRLHTSFWWMQDITKLRKAIQKLQKRYYEFNPFIPYMYKQQNKWYRFDTGANLYASLTDQCYAFRPKELNCYDHTFEGTHISIIIKDFQGKLGVYTKWLHDSAKNDHTKLKHTWRQQVEVFKNLSPKKYKI